MRKFITVILLIIGLALAGLAYSFYSDYKIASNVARFYQTYPDEVPKGESREQNVADALMVADRNRNLAMLSGAASLLLWVGGAALFTLGRRKDTDSASQLIEDPAQRSEEMNRWASAALALPVKVHYRRRYGVLYACIVLFFICISALVIVANGFTSTSILLLILNGILLIILYYLQSRAQRRAAHFFDLFGVTRGDNRRFSWSEFKNVDYLMAIKPRSGEEYLWRVELAFNSGAVWIIPQRVETLEEINNLVASLPGVHQKRRA